MINNIPNVVLPGMRFTIDGENGINNVGGCSDRIYYTDSSREYGLFKSYDEYPKIHFLTDWDYVFCYAEAVEGNGKFIRFFVYADKEFKKFYYDQESYKSMTDLYDIDHVKLISISCLESVVYEYEILNNGTVLKEIIVDEFHPNIHKTSRFLIAGYCSYNGRRKKFFYDSLLNKYYVYPYNMDYNWGEEITEITEVEVDKEHPLFILADECDVIPLLDDNKLNAKIISIPLYYSTESLEGFDSKIL